MIFLLGQDEHRLVHIKEMILIMHRPTRLKSRFMAADQVSRTKIQKEKEKKKWLQLGHCNKVWLDQLQVALYGLHAWSESRFEDAKIASILEECSKSPISSERQCPVLLYLNEEWKTLMFMHG